jgi:hypothetical protein
VQPLEVPAAAHVDRPERLHAVEVDQLDVAVVVGAERERGAIRRAVA